MEDKKISLGGNIWKLAAVDDGLADRMALAYNLPNFLALVKLALPSAK